MYVPTQFEERRLPVLHAAMAAAGLATLVTMGGDGLEATPLPLVLEPDEGPLGTLYGHLARANPQWRRVDPAVPALVLLQGPDAYVTPSWYPSKREAGKAVPTWNYVAVHAYGPLETFDDPARLQALVTKLTDRHEAGRPEPWAVSDAPADYLAAMLRGIVGIRVPITRLDGKWKASQNRSPEDRAGVVDGLRREGGPGDAAMAAVMEAL